MAHPPRFRDDDPLLARVRSICLGLPEAQEKISHGRPNFYTKKVFASYGATVKGDHYSDEYDQSVLVVPAATEREALLQDERFFVPAYVGAYGWIGLNLRIGAPDWDEVRELVAESYRATAPARLVTELDRTELDRTELDGRKRG